MTTDPRLPALAGATSDGRNGIGPDDASGETEQAPPAADAPNPAGEDGLRSAVAVAGEEAPDAAPPTPLAWLGEAVVTGLVHCACAHHVIHPDLLTLATRDVEAVQHDPPATDGGAVTAPE